MDFLLCNENVAIRKRKSKDPLPGKTKVKTVSSSDRKPLQDVELGVNQAESRSAKLDDTIDETIRPVTNVATEQSLPVIAENEVDPHSSMDTADKSIKDYCIYLKSIMTEQLYNMLERDVLSKISPDTSMECLEWLVSEFLQPSQPTPAAISEVGSPTVTTTKRKRRRTADVDIINAKSAIFTPSPPLDDDVVSRRRSRRIRRKSLAVYKEQGTLPSNDARFSEDISDLPRTKSEEVQARPNCEFADLTLVQSHSLSDHLPGSSQAEDPNDCMSKLDIHEVNNETFAIEDSSDHGLEENLYISPDLENLYRNKNFRMPNPKPFATIFEEPRTSRGNEMLCSKTERYRYFDFTDGSWYRIPLAKENMRKRKARRAGWRRTSSAQSDELLVQRLVQLDTSLADCELD